MINLRRSLDHPEDSWGQPRFTADRPRAATLPAWRRHEREPRTDVSQVELQLHGLRVAPRRGLHQLRREDRGADPRVPLRRTRRRAVLGCLPRGDRAVLLHAARALARAASAVAVGATATAAMPRPAIGEAAGALESVGAASPSRGL